MILNHLGMKLQRKTRIISKVTISYFKSPGNIVVISIVCTSFGILLLASFAPIGRYVAATGKLEAQQSLSVTAPYSGVIKGVYYREGQIANSGKVLIELTTQSTQKQLKDMNALISRIGSETSIVKCVYEEGADASIKRLSQCNKGLDVASGQFYEQYYVEFLYKQRQLRTRLMNSLNTKSLLRLKIKAQEAVVRKAKEKYIRAKTLESSGALSKFQLSDLESQYYSTLSALLDYKNQLNATSSEIADAELRLNETRNEYTGTIARTKYIELSQRLNDLTMQRDRIKYELSTNQIKAPFKGYIHDSSVEVGQLVEQGRVLLRISTKEIGGAVIFIESKSRPMIKQGDKVTFSINGLSDNGLGDFSAAIKFVSPATLTNEEVAVLYAINLPPGLYYSANIEKPRLDKYNYLYSSSYLKPGMTINASIKLADRSLLGMFGSFLEDRVKQLRDNP